MSQSLYERLGGTDGITRIANDLVDIHVRNPTIARRYVDSDLPAVKKAAAEFFISGTGGPDVYTGKDMVAAHRGMNISNDEFMAVLDDVIEALGKNGIPKPEQEEVLFIFFGMKGDVVGQ